jgi:hypothetical protein
VADVAAHRLSRRVAVTGGQGGQDRLVLGGHVDQ